MSVSVLSGLMYEEEGALIDLMTCAIRQATQATPPVGRTHGKKVVMFKYMKILCGVRGCEKSHYLLLLFVVTLDVDNHTKSQL